MPIKITRRCGGSYIIRVGKLGAEVSRSFDDPLYWRSSATDGWYRYLAEAKASTIATLELASS